MRLSELEAPSGYTPTRIEPQPARLPSGASWTGRYQVQRWCRVENGVPLSTIEPEPILDAVTGEVVGHHPAVYGEYEYTDDLGCRRTGFAAMDGQEARCAYLRAREEREADREPSAPRWAR